MKNLLFAILFLLLAGVSSCSRQPEWKGVALNDLLSSGKMSHQEEAERMRNGGRLPDEWIVIERNDLGMILETTDDATKGKGLRLLSLVDKESNVILSARESVPLFTVEMIDKVTGQTVTIHAADGWNAVEADRKSEQFVFTGAQLPEGEKLCVVLKTVNGKRGSSNGFDWLWQVRQNVERYEFRKLNCPQISLRNQGQTMKAFYPYASGVATEDPCGKKCHWKETYPNGWNCSMQWTAVYDESKNTGFYLAMHDPNGAVMDIQVDAKTDDDAVIIRYTSPFPLDGSVKDVEHGGGVWRTFRGDWYDASRIYRQWVKNEAQWYKKLKIGPDGRTDTPQWMKELCVWALSSEWGDSPQASLQGIPVKMKKFTEALGIPTALHLYNWHQIPFDNDYPHYFPVRDGFAEVVAAIQKIGNCYVMPYINGRLWDTRDKGMEDFQFSSIALPAATKKEDGSPYIETYGSTEADGSKVMLAVMCPATDVWKDKVSENVLRLTNDYHTDGVYIDQITASTPQLCFDKSHGHPLAGGSWWVSEYGSMLEKIRGNLHEGKMLTSECNAEPYIHVFDGYLTWHFQYQDQVPAFASIYGGTVQLFGRNGGGDALALRMKMGQQLVFGEQIGWIGPDIVDNQQLFPFFREVVLTRYKYRDYFYKGEMIRPPGLLDEIPTVTADWKWFTTVGKTVTTDAVLTGAWRKTDEKGRTVSAVFFFVNVSDEPVTSRVAIRLDEVGLAHEATFDKPMTFEPGVPVAVEVF